ncbi:MAG TPA: acyclic terpene utilization AtuA family protein [Pirellulales bacterium]|nr:acyclic terpene utilization AtuA family protein [Pirellulales bacterium]
MILKIANGAGFLGDNVDAPRRLVEAAEVDYLTLEYLAELTLSILARVREKDPAAGYAEDFLGVLDSLVPALNAQPRLKLVTNAGGMNPVSCAHAVARILIKVGLNDTPIGVVTGDDLLADLAMLQAAGCAFTNLDTRQALATLNEPVVSANAYLGAREIAGCLDSGARIVITGRVADASLTVGPAVHAFGWSWDDWRRLAAASVAGHMIECGAQATGGFYPHWREIDLANIGYPIAELNDAGDVVITKPPGSGGVVNRETVAEQLVYEIGDPAHYLTPDVDVDFSTVEAEELGHDRVAVRGATGRPAPESYKVSLAYRAGFMASGQMLIYGRDAAAKARACAEIVLDRLRLAGHKFERSFVECLGAGESVPSLAPPPAELREVMLRLSVHDPRRETVERFAKEFAPLATSGPAGLAGYASGRPQPRPVFAYWPTLVPKRLVKPRYQVRAAADWIQ